MLCIGVIKQEATPRLLRLLHNLLGLDDGRLWQIVDCEGKCRGQHYFVSMLFRTQQASHMNRRNTPLPWVVTRQQNVVYGSMEGW